MPTTPLQNLSVLLVEDNLYIRDILEQTLRHLGFEKIVLARNGEDAVKLLKLLNHSGNPGAGVLNVDLIMSDLVMSPINGVLLLKWIRQQKDSPNRFVPFIMVSGAADREYVEAARDLGTTEFLAKPFSVNSVYERIQWVIDHPRPFIACQSYFGPDRRRRHLPTPEGLPDRRRQGDDHITQVYSADNVKRPRNPSDVWVFRLPNTLKEKLGGNLRAAFALPRELLEEAEQQLERSALDFHEWAVNYLSRLADLVEQTRRFPAHRRQDLDEINLVAHELRGQGGTFGYPLITVFAKSLYEATRSGCSEHDSHLGVVEAHIDAMRAVIRDRIAGDGGEVGRELLRTLTQAIARHDEAGRKPGRP
ncbi:response regulator [Roseospirillum parvum]|uniref:Response regulator receiver domain-containing protein n=1 Tax=Roseospirillum parvum TaxID=83401 RepID=A0A1G7XQB8_9PROT|nr:response regulator [Roseospirillum parvum]SDG86286.1 Response regulator receiver domain-containing protein [Roseospirillum parvum]